MALVFKYDSVFTPNGLANLDEQFFPESELQQEEAATFNLTQAERKGLNGKNKSHDKDSRQTFALTIEECKPIVDYHIGDYTPLPSNVSFERIVIHVGDSFKNGLQLINNRKIDSIKTGFQQKKTEAGYTFVGYGQGSKFGVSKGMSVLLEEKEEMAVTKLGEEERKQFQKLNAKLNVWKRYLSLPENKAVISDAFWYARYKFVPDAQAEQIKELLLKRISKNYVNLFVTANGAYKDAFFTNYFDIVAQSVYYILFYACPKTRDRLNNKIKEDLLVEFSNLFAGVEVTSPAKYYGKWYLDLGGGNILEAEEISALEQKRINLPPIDFRSTPDCKVIRKVQVTLKNDTSLLTKPLKDVTCSPVVGRFLESEKYQTRNLIKGLKVNFSKLDYDPVETEARFEKYREIAKKINSDVQELKIEEKVKGKELRTSLKKLREENIRHQRRLSKRRDEELANGAHEYANFLVSILRTYSPKSGRPKK